MKLDGYIKEVLFTKDLVIVPEFGGFVCKHFAAEINPATQMFMPPSKKVVFQAAIKNADLSLALHISRSSKTSLTEAQLIIRQNVARWNDQLANGEHVLLEDIGRIYRDVNGALSFQADLNANFNTQSFGLGIYRFPKLKQEEKISTSVGSAFQKVGHKPSTFSLSGYWKAAAMVAGIAGLFYLGTQKSDFQQLNYARVNPLYFSKTTDQPAVTPEKENTPVVITKGEERSTKPVIVSEPKAEEPTKESTPVTAPTPVEEPASFSGPTYHVIVGAFKEQGNAHKMTADLVARGYAQAVSFYDRGFYKVSVHQYQDRPAAATALKSYKSKVQKGAWIFKK